jgi:hypothetical protein
VGHLYIIREDTKGTESERSQLTNQFGKQMKEYLSAGAGALDWREACIAASS